MRQPPSRRTCESVLTKAIAGQLGCEPAAIEPDVPLGKIGIQSVLSLAEPIALLAGIELDASQLDDQTMTLEELLDVLCGETTLV